MGSSEFAQLAVHLDHLISSGYLKTFYRIVTSIPEVPSLSAIQVIDNRTKSSEIPRRRILEKDHEKPTTWHLIIACRAVGGPQYCFLSL